ncbi:amino acid adenylation domain-containing protein [Serratia fonticola]|jgi:amino acid adenylation domain-containing protein|uniref:amino acid adenylation domain-containing protein n=1 Tax=Serratia fonticola TaxID=47917 RepID=UPI003AACE1E1
MVSENIVHAKFMQQSNNSPNSIALRCDKHKLTYRQLDHYTNALAAQLISRGVQPGDIIGVYLNKGLDLVISLLGILKAGACYLPLDPYYPVRRLAYMIGHANTKLVITDTAPEAVLNVNALRCEWLDITRLDLTVPVALTLPKVSDDHLCYVMYTSGSTGTPKGVMVSHRTVVHYLEWMQAAFHLRQNDVVLNQSSFSFDVSVWEIFWPLTTGASCALIAEEKKYDPSLIANFIQNHQVSVAQFVPTALRIIVDAGVVANCRTLTHIFSGGEALPQSLVDDLGQQFSGQIHNLYGPTEATIFACHWSCRPGERESMVPIGRPIPHACAYVLDEQLRPVPTGCCGELYLGGDILAKGYLHAEALTDERFVDNPFTGADDNKMYRTGDWVRLLDDGVLAFIGRVDDQIKLRGHRIELAEIETHLQALPQISHAAVIVETPPGKNTPTLSAFYVPRHQQPVNIQELKSCLAKSLPFFMVPSRFISLRKMPVHPNGKVDKSNLHSYEQKDEEDMNEIKAKMNTEVEAEIISVWRKVLNNKNLSAKDNFFDAGGNSLLMSKVHREIKDKFSTPVSIMDLFQYPTVQMLSQRIVEKHAEILGKKK